MPFINNLKAAMTSPDSNKDIINSTILHTGPTTPISVAAENTQNTPYKHHHIDNLKQIRKYYEVLHKIKVSLKFNSVDRWEPKSLYYFTHISPMLSVVGAGNKLINVSTDSAQIHSYEQDHTVNVSNIGFYSFCLPGYNNSLTTPSGSCNFSRIGDVELAYHPNTNDWSTTHGLTVFAVNWNWLKISNGMAGVEFSN